MNLSHARALGLSTAELFEAGCFVEQQAQVLPTPTSPPPAIPAPQSLPRKTLRRRYAQPKISVGVQLTVEQAQILDQWVNRMQTTRTAFVMYLIARLGAPQIKPRVVIDAE